MNYIFLIPGGSGFVIAGVAGKWYGYMGTASVAGWLMAAGTIMLILAMLRTTYYRSDTPWPDDSAEPRALRLKYLHYVKALICWFDGYKRTYAVAPGLYYTGDRYDPEKPLLVTSNYLLTVLVLTRRVRFFNARLLIIDTDGINVWCSAGKGRFSNPEISRQLVRYQELLLCEDRRLTLILPKFSLSGVDLRMLREAFVHPVIGPLYAKDLPEYLTNPPYKDNNDIVHFGFQSRLFTWLPGLAQFLGYCLALILVLFGLQIFLGFTVPWRILAITALIATLYPLLFPYIPGDRFAIKGLWLGVFISLMLIPGVFVNAVQWVEFPMTVPFIFATGLFVGLAYTGNSAVSNYSTVRKEIARFLPVNVLLYVAALIAFIVTAVYS